MHLVYVVYRKVSTIFRPYVLHSFFLCIICSELNPEVTLLWLIVLTECAICT